jgi:hypothetical protein
MISGDLEFFPICHMGMEINIELIGGVFNIADGNIGVPAVIKVNR